MHHIRVMKLVILEEEEEEEKYAMGFKKMMNPSRDSLDKRYWKALIKN